MDQPFSTHQHDDTILAVGYSPSGDQLAVGGHDRAVTIYQPTTFTVIRRLELENIVYALSYSPDGKYLAAGGMDNKAIFSASDFEMVRQIPFDASAYAICFAADSRHMAVGGDDKKVTIFDTSNFARVKEGEQGNNVEALSYSPNGKYLLVGLSNNFNNAIAEVDATTCTIARETNVGYVVRSISHSLTGKYIAVGSNDRTMIYEADNLTSINEYKLDGWNRAAFHPDGTLTITYDNTITHVDTLNWNDDSPFHAAIIGDVQALKAFLDSGEDINAKNLKGKTALMYALENGQTQAAEFLMENGADAKQHQNTTGGINDSPKLPPDRLGYQVYAEGISTVASSNENPSASLCVGLIAPWGAGKTFIWRLIKHCLIDAAATRADEIKERESTKEDESTKQPVSRLQHTAVLALAAWCWVARMLVRIFCLNCRRDDEDEEVLNSSLKEEEKVATMMILIFPIGIIVWIICFLFVIMFHVILFILKVAPEVLFVPVKVICCGCDRPLKRVKKLWKDLSEVKDAETDPVIPDCFFFCCQDRKKENVDEENQNQETTENLSTILKWSRVHNVLTGGGNDIYSSRDFEHISFCGQIQILLLSSFQNLLKACLAALSLSCMNFIFPKNYKIEKEMTKYIFVEFDAWVYSGTDLLWAKLIEMLWVSVENECGSFSVRLHRASISLSNEKEDDDLKTKCNKRKAAIIFYVIYILIAFVFGCVTTCILLFQLTNDGGKVLSSLSFSPTLLFIVHFAVKVLPELLESRGVKILKQVRSFEKFDRQGFSLQTGFMGEVAKEVEYLFDFLRTTYVNDDKIKRRRPIRLAVFVDDLDRCPNNAIMPVLEAVILLLVDAPITCYLAIDTRRVVTSIENYFGDRFIEAGLNGYQYLEKIIQLPFCLPNLDQVSKENFLTKALEGDMLDSLKLYQRLVYLHNENIPEIKEFFIKPKEDPRDTKEAISALIPCLEQMIQKNIFKDENTLLHSPQEALEQIRVPSSKSNIDNKRIQDEFYHWISIGIELVLVKWRSGSSSNLDTPGDDNSETVDQVSLTVPLLETQTSPLATSEHRKMNQQTTGDGNSESGPNPAPEPNPTDSIDSFDQATPIIRHQHPKQISYDTLFTPLATSEELGWFCYYAKYFVGKPRKMNRIINSYMVSRIISNIKRQQTDNSLPFNRKLLKFIILLEQWPYKMAWILLIVEIFQHEKDLTKLEAIAKLAKEANAKLAKEDNVELAKEEKNSIGATITSLIKKIPESEENLSLFQIYTHIVQVLVHSSDDSAIQLQRDGDAQVFKKILMDNDSAIQLQRDGDAQVLKKILLDNEDIYELKMKDIFRPEHGGMDSLRQYAFNLQRHTIEKVAVELESCVLEDDDTNGLSYKKKSEVFKTKTKK